ncbi:unnamed protein product [Linum tenue]|uniref:Uncharacterized protein n=1 Tax=Linum tenue TaxID=586396 RepID=A0AAV0KSJ1_9ROSI|nr:unnamed protein product [Linum tenue]
MALHNYIRMNAIYDEEFQRCDEDPNYPVEVGDYGSQGERRNESTIPDDRFMNSVRDSIAASLRNHR